MKKSNCIEFYFDCSSPWTYLAFIEILPLSQRQNIKIIWKPILVGGVFNLVNQDVYQFREKPNPLKLAYSNHDLNLWVKIRKTEIFIPKIFPINSVNAMRGCLFAITKNRLPEFAEQVFKSYWSKGSDISKVNLLQDIAKKLNLNPLDFKNYIESFEAKELLIKNTEELIRRGGFGSPTLYYNKHMFFGNDRLSLFEESYQNGLLD